MGGSVEENRKRKQGLVRRWKKSCDLMRKQIKNVEETQGERKRKDYGRLGYMSTEKESRRSTWLHQSERVT